MIIGAIIEGVTTRKDKTCKLSIGTQELTPNDAAELFNMNQKFCYVAIKEEAFTSNELNYLESLKTDFDTIKSPSQRLRGILFRNYEMNAEGFKDFNNYYVSKIELICEHFKSKLI